VTGAAGGIGRELVLGQHWDPNLPSEETA